MIGSIAPLRGRVVWSTVSRPWRRCRLVALASTWTQRALFLQAMPGAAAVMSLIESGLALAGIAMTYQADLLTTPVALAITATASLIACLISSYIVRPRLRSASARSLVEALKIGATFHPGQMALQLLIRFDIVLLAAFSGLAAVGLYSVAVSLDDAPRRLCNDRHLDIHAPSVLWRR